MKQSAGILLYNIVNLKPEFFLVHPGGPFFAKKNEGCWTIPKGEFLDNEFPLNAAMREFEEETGYKPTGPFIELQPIIQKAGKKVYCWAALGELDAEGIMSNTFEMVWPPKSGNLKSFPEVDKAGWFNYDAAKVLINERQIDLLDQLIAIVKEKRPV